MNQQSIRIRPLTMDDFSFVLDWSKDESFCRANDWQLNRNEEELFKWWHHCVNYDAQDFIRWGIEYNEKIIGYVDLAFIQENTAELGIAIGDSKIWGRGIGYTAALHTMDYGYKNLEIKIFEAETHEDNIRSQRLLKKLGFKEMSRNGYEEYLGRKNQLIQYRVVL